jgi:hypothetical protein
MFKGTEFWYVMKRQFEESLTLQMNISPPSSRSKRKISKKSAEADTQLASKFYWSLA